MKKKLTGLICAIVSLTLLCSLVPAPVLAEDLRTVSIMCQAERRTDHPLSRIEEYTCYQELKGWLAEKGVELTFDLISPEQYDTTLEMRLAAQLELSDIVSLNWSYPDTQAVQQAQAGTFLNVMEACEQYDEDGSIWRYIDELVPATKGLTTAPDGGVYWFVYPYCGTFYHLDENGTVQKYEDFKGASCGININLDWLKECGIEYDMFMTPQEFKDALVAFREQDASGDGAQNEVLDINITGFVNGIACAFGLFDLACVVDDSDQVHCAWYADGITDYLTYMKQLYDLGVYDTKCLSEGMIDQICAAGEASAFYQYHGWSSTYDFTVDKYLYAPIVLDEDAGENGFRLAHRDTPQSIYMKFVITNACQDVEAAIDVFDCVYTPEYAVLSYYGTEKTYDIDENGFKFRNYDTALLNDPNWLDLPLMYTLSMNGLPAVNHTNFLLETYTHFPAWDEYCEFADYIYANDAHSVNRPNLQALALPTAAETETLNALTTVLTTYSSELLTDMILGNKSISELDTYIEEMKSLGLDDYLAVYQARHDRFLEASK